MLGVAVLYLSSFCEPCVALLCADFLLEFFKKRRENKMNVGFFLMSIGLGAGLAMDAFLYRLQTVLTSLACAHAKCALLPAYLHFFNLQCL